MMTPGAVYYCAYLNWHNDPNPLAFILYSDMNYTHAINIHYISLEEYKELVNMFNKMKKPTIGNMFFKNPRKFYYEFLKKHFKQFVDISYRTYFTNQLTGIIAHPIMLSKIGSRYAERFQVKQHPEISNYKHQSLTDIHVKQLKHDIREYGVQSTTLSVVKSIVRDLKNMI